LLKFRRVHDTCACVCVCVCARARAFACACVRACVHACVRRHTGRPHTYIHTHTYAYSQQLGEGVDIQDDDLRTQLAACEAEMDALRERHAFSQEPEPQTTTSLSSSSTATETPKVCDNGHDHHRSAGNDDHDVGGENMIHSPRLVPKSDEFEDDDSGSARNDAEEHVYDTRQPSAHVSTNDSTRADGVHASDAGDVGARNHADDSAGGDAFDIAAAVAQRDALQRDIGALENTLEQLVAAEDFDTAAIVQTQIEKMQDDLAVVSVSLVGRELDQDAAARQLDHDGEHKSSSLSTDDDDDDDGATARGHDSSTRDMQQDAPVSESLEAKSSSFSFVDEVHAVATGGNGLVGFSIASDGEDAVTHTDTASNADESQWQVHGHGESTEEASMEGMSGNASNLHGMDGDNDGNCAVDDGNIYTDTVADAHDGDSGMETSSELIETTAQGSGGDSFVDAEDATTSGSAFSFLS
jgi:hypothetical protein